MTSEYFFERPGVLSREYPDVYRLLAAFYKQDPGRRIHAPVRPDASPRVLQSPAAAAVLLASCATLVNSSVAGSLVQGAINLQAETAGITGTIVDRTGELLAVEDDHAQTIYCVSVGPLPPRSSARHARERDGQVRGGDPRCAVAHDESAARPGPPPRQPRTTVRRRHARAHPHAGKPQLRQLLRHFSRRGQPAAGLSEEGMRRFTCRPRSRATLPTPTRTAQAATNGGRMDRFVARKAPRILWGTTIRATSPTTGRTRGDSRSPTGSSARSRGRRSRTTSSPSPRSTGGVTWNSPADRRGAIASPPSPMR